MAQENSSVVAIIAIVIIVLFVGALLYFIGFRPAREGAVTVAPETNVTTPATGTTGGTTSTTGT